MPSHRQPPGPNQRLRPAMIPPEAVVQKASKKELTEIERLAAKIAPALAKAILEHLDKVAEGVSLKALIEALKSGNMGEVIEQLAAVSVAAATAKTADALQTAIWGGAAIATAQIGPKLRGVEFYFDRLNPQLVTFLQQYTLRLIREIDGVTKEAIRESLLLGMADGSNPVTTARSVRATIGLTKRQANAVKAYRKQLETFHQRSSAEGFGIGQKIDRVNGRQVYRPGPDGKPLDGITERRLRDFRYDSHLAAAIKDSKPIPPEKIDKMVAAYARKYRRYRSEMIARTESLRATNYGVQEAWRQLVQGGNVAEAQVRRQWKVAADERLCEVCAPIPGMNPKRGVKFDQPFATPKGPVMLPPIHPACRCTVFIRMYEPEQLA